MFISNQTLLAVEAIALENPEGFTLHFPTMQLVNSGIVVAYEATQNSFGRSGLWSCIEHCLYQGHGFIGGWINPEGKMQYDSVRIMKDPQKAIEFGRIQHQYSIFDLDNGIEIKL